MVAHPAMKTNNKNNPTALHLFIAFSLCCIYLGLVSVELKFAKEVRVSDQSCSRKRASRTPTVSPPFAKGETKRGWISGSRFLQRRISLRLKLPQACPK